MLYKWNCFAVNNGFSKRYGISNKTPKARNRKGPFNLLVNEDHMIPKTLSAIALVVAYQMLNSPYYWRHHEPYTGDLQICAELCSMRIKFYVTRTYPFNSMLNKILTGLISCMSCKFIRAWSLSQKTLFCSSPSQCLALNDFLFPLP